MTTVETSPGVTLTLMTPDEAAHLAKRDGRTIKELAQEAINVQHACNPLGLTKGLARSLQTLRERLEADGLPHDTQAICGHPIFRLWVSKLHDLAGMGLSDDAQFTIAWNACTELIEAE